MQIGKVSGSGVAFLIFAVMLLSVPVSTFLGRQLQLASPWVGLTVQIGQLSTLAIIVLALERFRRGLVSSMLQPLPSNRRLETAAVICAQLLFPFALFGSIVLLHWIPGGPLAVEQRFPTAAIHTADQAHAYSMPGVLTAFAAIAIAPIVEEIVFRGFLYRAWEERWGWLSSMLLTSAVFALYHPNFASAFIQSVVLVCIYRRTGTLIAPIVVHTITNSFAWYPLMGQFVIPSPELPAGDLVTWRFHLLALTLYVVALPTYVFMSRHPHEREAR